MPRFRFSICCLVISAAAFGALWMSAPDMWSGFWTVLHEYAYGTALMAFLFIVMHYFGQLCLHLYVKESPYKQDSLAWSKDYFARLPFVDIGAAVLALIITVTSFTTFKTAVVGANGYGYDATFIAWDRAIFGGQDGWEWTHSIASSATATRVIDLIYHPLFLPMVVGFFICVAAQRQKALRHTYILSYLSSMFIIGMVMAAAMHSGGPVFDGVVFGDGSTFAPLMATQETQLAQGGGPRTANVLAQYLATLQINDQTRIGAGISAMPSMHIVLALLWVFPAWHLNKALGVVTALYAALIWFGSVHLGWHYFVDGLVSLIVLTVIWRICGHITGLYQLMRATT